MRVYIYLSTVKFILYIVKISLSVANDSGLRFADPATLM